MLARRSANENNGQESLHKRQRNVENAATRSCSSSCLPTDLTRAWRYLAVLSEEGLHDVAHVLDILFFEIVVRREIESAVSKTLGFLELDIVCLSTLEEIHP